MSYITFTYNQYDALLLQSKFTMLQHHCTEVSVKQCLSIIPGLISRSFKFTNETQVNMFLTLFNNIPVWIKHGLKSIEELDSQLQIIDKCDTLMEVSFGYLASTAVYSWSKNIQNNRFLKWRTNVSNKYMAIQYQINELLELRLTKDCLDKYFIISTINSGIYMIILPIKASPRCYAALKRVRGKSIYYERRLGFENIDGSCLADASALCLRFHNQELATACVQFLINVLKLDCHVSPVNCIRMPTQTWHFNHILSDFWSSYACQMLLALGYRIKRQITQNTLVKIMILSRLSQGEQYPNHQCYSKLMAIYYRARYNRFFDINKEFDNIQPIPQSIVLDKWEYVPRAYLTPYGLFPLPVKPMRGNRILRQRHLFGPAENFCRIIIRDVDLGQPQKDFMDISETWIKGLIKAEEHVTVGERQFDFLLCSNSQLRDRSFWFHSRYRNRGVSDIRNWMGDFSREKCIGTYIARMALSLTGTNETITLLPRQMEQIDDKLDEVGRIFTDGAGKISPMALKHALMVYNPDLVEADYMPCIIQARLNGIKGLFILAPDLVNRGELIQYRPSQHKFDANHNVLEIVKHSSSGMAFLNRQIIVLLENMGVQGNIFLRLQNKARMRISMSLLANRSAQRTLEQNVRYCDWQRMHKAGIQLTKEPFSRSLLLLLAQERLKRLKERSHVQISLSDGRMLLGIVDETNSLEYGQVFIQLRDLNGQSQIIQDRKILITKNPAHFPGDILKLDAVDRPALHHLFECVVFPAKGKRPHPNEISGSDLDGDENATLQHPPALFDSAGKVKHNGEISIVEIAEFLFKYLSSDSLGVLSNRHLACCAVYGPSHDKSCRLAQIIAEAVDFPKTGVLPKIPSDIKIDEYPDFMESKYKKSFESKSSLGTMYRQVRQVWKIHFDWQNKIEEEHVNIDQDFLIRGYEDYILEAKTDYQYYCTRINIMLSVYNLVNEYELITGCHSCVEEEKKNNDSVETASLEFRHLIHEMRQRFASEELNHRKQQQKASAWYYVAYEAGSILSFGWIMDRLMSDIIKRKHIIQEEHQALKRIGKAILNHGIHMAIRRLASSCDMTNEEYRNCSETEILGSQFLRIIDYSNESTNEQEFAHKFLIFLHKLGLDIL